VVAAAPGRAGEVTQEQVELFRALLREALPAAIRDVLPAWYVPAIALLLIALVAGLAAYGGSYLQAKGHRRAIEETLDEIERRAEEMKAEVSGGLWLRQKRWNLRRQLYSQLLTALDEVDYALGIMVVADQQARIRAEVQDEAGFNEYRASVAAAQRRTTKAFRKVANAKALAGVLLPPDAIDILEGLENEWHAAEGKGAGPRGLGEMWSLLALSADRARRRLTDIARKDLVATDPDHQQ
jgi:hypothetical protein